MTPLQLLQESHRELLTITLAYHHVNLTKVAKDNKTRLAIEKVINKALAIKKSVAETTD
jgi:hypothetical protein